MDEIHTPHDIQSTVNSQGRQLARHGAAIESLVESTRKLAHTVDQIPIGINEGLARIHEKMDLNERNNRPDVKWAVAAIGGTITLLLTAFSVILSLTVSPMRNDMATLKDDAMKDNDSVAQTLKLFRTDYNLHKKEFHERAIIYAENISSGIANHNANLNEIKEIKEDIDRIEAQHTREIVELRDELLINTSKISALEMAYEWHTKWINDVDRAGSRKWVLPSHVETK